MQYIVLDLECIKNSTVKPRQEIVELGAHRIIVDGKTMQCNMADSFHAYVKPCYNDYRKLPHKLTKLTGITPEILKNADYFEDVYEDFMKWVGNESTRYVCWGGNDLVMMQTNCKAHMLPQLKNSSFSDLQKDFDRKYGHDRPTSLSNAIAEAGIGFDGQAHCALDDAYNTGKLFIALS